MSKTLKIFYLCTKIFLPVCVPKSIYLFVSQDLFSCLCPKIYLSVCVHLLESQNLFTCLYPNSQDLFTCLCPNSQDLFTCLCPNSQELFTCLCPNRFAMNEFWADELHRTLDLIELHLLQQ